MEASQNDREFALKGRCPPVPLEHVLAAELAEIKNVREMRGIKQTGDKRPSSKAPEAPIAGKADPGDPKWWTNPDAAEWVEAIKNAHAANLVGLAFSGGGIRSATFNLGVLQALAELKLLHRVDYLSTVSGGGYIGGWLAAWTKRVGSFGEVQKRLATNRVHQIDDKEPPPIRFLRMFSNYLTPKLGFFGGDTLAMIAIYLRNMLLNQVVVLAVMTLLLLLPRAVVNIVSLSPLAEVNGWVWVAAGGGLLVLAFLVIFNNMSFLDSRQAHALTWLTEQKWILWLVCGPLSAVAILAALWPARTISRTDLPFELTASYGAAAYASLWFLSSAIAYGFDYWSERKLEERAKHAEVNAKQEVAKPKKRRDRLAKFGFGLAGAACAGALAGCLYAFLSEGWWCWDRQKELTLGAPLVLGIFLLAGTLHIGLMGTVFHDSAREWWGRVGGWLLLWGAVWMAIFGVTLYFPEFIRNNAAWKGIAAKYLTPTWIVTTLASVAAGKSTASGEPGKQTWKDLVAKVGPYVFIAGLVCWISWCIYKIGGNYIAGYQIFAAILICAVVALVMSLRVDVNQFSMHLFYRNRLVRCYLGASNKKRFPNQFTGFDPDDDMPLKDLRQENGYDGPYPVINASLNLVKGKDLAWQERKAESFVMTPQFCGYDVWLEEQDSPLLMKERLEDQRLDKGTAAGMAGNTPATEAITGDADLDISAPTVPQRHGLDRYGYRPTAQYAFPSPLDGPRLGLAMGMSGAAASPNMGFYSSPPVAFLMTLFDVRLGQWLGNPRNPKTWQRATPRFGLTYLLNELFAGTNDDAAYIYLSDGGHFENMGLYELVKRRCGLIIVCDVEADDCYGFTGLGNAIRKCRIDMGIDIALDLTEIAPPKVGEPSAKHCAIGTIHYEAVDLNAPSGTIIYFKASLTGDEPSDIRDYHTMHGQFPHESTIDQWFSESQFESYRVLGYHEVMTSMNSRGAVGIPAAIPGASGQTTAAQSDSTAVAANWKTVAASAVQAAAAAVAHAAAKLSSAGIEVTEGEQTIKTEEGLKPLQEKVSDALNKFGFDTAKLSSNETSDSR